MLAYILVLLPCAVLYVIVARKTEKAFKYLALIGYTLITIVSIILDFKDVFGEMNYGNITFKQVLNL